MSSKPFIDADEVASLSQLQALDEKASFDAGSTDSVVDASLLPTHEETRTLRRVADSVALLAWAIIFVEFAERLSWYGTTGPMRNFVQQPLPEGSKTSASPLPYGVAGALGRGQHAATALSIFRQIYGFFTPIVGAIVADTYLGRFGAIVVLCVVCLIGHIILVIVSTPAAIQHPNGAFTGFIISLVIMGLGTGGLTSNIPPFAAEQHQGKLHKRILPSGETVIVDPALTVQKTFMYFYMANSCAAVLSIATTYAENRVGFWLAYTVPTLIFCFIPPVLLWGNKGYHKTPPRGSILVESWRIFRTAAHGRWSVNPVILWKAFTASNFWEPARPSRQQGNAITSAGGAHDVITWDGEFVDEIMRAIKACKVFLFYPVYWIAYDQTVSYLTLQAIGMSSRLIISIEIIGRMHLFLLVIMIPLMDLIVYPALRKMKINFTPIKRITAGFLLGALAMIYTAVIQHYIYKKSPCGTYALFCSEPAPVSVWLQAPSYILISLSEIFVAITGLEYAFTKAPERMRSVVMSVFLFMSIISYAVEWSLVGVSVDPYMTWMYAGVGIATFVFGCAFWFIFRQLDGQEDMLNAIGATGRGGFKGE